jgi:hypothetical protein
MALSDKAKADFFLLGVILTFLLLTLIAFLLNEGKKYCVAPLMMKLFPKRYNGVAKDDDNGYNDANHRRSTYAKTRVDDENFSESREMNTIAEQVSVDGELTTKSNKRIPKINIDDTTCDL